jgi:signal transduction histidine kinase
MKLPDRNSFNIGRSLALTLAVLICVILVGNGLVILQYENARRHADRLTGVSQQLIAAMRLQQSLLSFHQQLNELVRSRNVSRLESEAATLTVDLRQRAQEARRTLQFLPTEFSEDPAFLTVLNTIEVTLPSQLHDLSALADTGDWEGIRLHLDDELRRVETTTEGHVNLIDRNLNQELPVAVANMKDVERRILVTVPVTAISTVLIAAFFGWAIARRMLELRLEERVAERTRIARELHDTMLQSLQGSLAQMQAARNLFSRRPEHALQNLDDAIAMTAGAIAEGRSAVSDLRSSAAIRTDLANALKALGGELAAGGAAKFQLMVEGPPPELRPAVGDEIYHIGAEALRNAFLHARAQHVEADLKYSDRLLRLQIRDDGVGITPQVLAEGRSNHFGLAGMHERAKKIRAKLEIWTGTGKGTEIDLSIPAAVAYRSSPPRSRWRPFKGD